MFHSSIYVGSPPRIQEAMISGRARARKFLREGTSYRALLSRARDRECWSGTQLFSYQSEVLQRLLEHAGRVVPYYSALFERLGFMPTEAELPHSMQSLPMLSKRDILEAGESLVAKSWRKGRIKGSTSGTTGTPITIVQDLAAINRENAFMARQLAWTGYSAGQPRAWMRGDMVVPADDAKGPYWRMNRAENMLMMSSYHLSEGTAAAYLRALHGFRPTLIQAFPSSISYLARFLETQDHFYESPCLRSIVTSSETLSDEDRRLIEERFLCKVFDWYGAFERVAAIGTCEEGAYHLLTDYSYVEFEPAGDGVFEIIGTGFNNFLMPLIRYRTGDLVELPEDGIECPCGRAFPVIKSIQGRRDDYIKLSDGRRIARMGHIFARIAEIAEAQIVQDELDYIRILVVPFKDFPDESEQLLIKNARQRLGKDVRIRVEVVPSIERTGSGKFRTIVCNI